MTLFPHPFDPRTAILITQWLFLALLLVSELAVALVDGAQLATVGTLVGLGVALAITLVLTVWRPVLTPAAAFFYVVPSIDIIAIALLRLDASDSASLAPLLTVVVPATWLGTSGRGWSIPLAFVLGGATIARDLVGAAASAPDTVESDFAALLMVPLVAAVSSLFGFQLVDEAETASSSERAARRTRDAIVDTADIGMIVLDGNGTPVIVNRALREHPVVRAEGPDPYSAIRSIPSFEADGRTPHTPEREPLMQAMTEEGMTDELFWARAHDGVTTAAFLANSRRLVDERGQLEGTVMVFTDVTAYVEAVRSRDRLISSVSHELRTPLTVMRGFLELATEAHSSGGERLAEYLQVVERNLVREFAIVDQLILAAQADMEPTSAQPTATELDAVTASALETFRLEAQAKSIELRFSAPTTSVPLDPRLFRLIAEALIANAVRFTPLHGQVDVSVDYDERAAGGGDAIAEGHGLVRLTVRDSGMGISAMDIERIFDPFFRAEAAMRSGAPGVGLGLPILKRILDGHEGTIQVQSELGGGTTVTVELPV
jgi:signal transduction histidine kinase